MPQINSPQQLLEQALATARKAKTLVDANPQVTQGTRPVVPTGGQQGPSTRSPQ